METYKHLHDLFYVLNDEEMFIYHFGTFVIGAVYILIWNLIIFIIAALAPNRKAKW
jgi:hypothetical protein